MLARGSVIGGYEIVAPLRAGGMAAFYLARRVGPAGFVRPVGIKVVHAHLATDRAFVEMFLDEARLSARIVHPNVVHVEELGESEGMFFLAMELVHGAPLSGLLRALSDHQRTLTPEVACAIAMKIADGLHAAHEVTDDQGVRLEVVHRDVSPQNVLIGADGRVKLIDFGVAKARGRLQESEAGALKGKLRYMSPEQAWGRPIDRRTDVYALGVVLWEALTGRRLFGGDTDLEALERVRAPVVPPPSAFAPSVSPAIDTVVLTALAVAVEERFDTAQAFRRALGNACPAALAAEPDDLGALVRAMLPEDLARERELLSGFGDPVPEARPDDAAAAERATQVTRKVSSSEPAATIAAAPAPPPAIPSPAPSSAPASRGPIVALAVALASVMAVWLALRPEAVLAPVAPSSPCDDVIRVTGADGATVSRPFDTREGTSAFSLTGLRNPAAVPARSVVFEYVVPGSGARSVDLRTANAATDPRFDVVIGIFRGVCESGMATRAPDFVLDDLGAFEDYRAGGAIRAEGGDTLTFVVSGYGGAVDGRFDEGAGELELTARQTSVPVLEAARVEVGATAIRAHVEGTDADGDARSMRLRFAGRDGSPIATLDFDERLDHPGAFAASGALEVGAEGAAAMGSAATVEVSVLDAEGNASAPLTVDVAHGEDPGTGGLALPPPGGTFAPP